ncbi:hypothetical protein SLS62_002294 [Diatrype stigma]|uniref:Uncharacterized protein n=1 Tax=Diatrype stigma TaxID=117547 RepID=A0AAN9UWS7_9PEZI
MPLQLDHAHEADAGRIAEIHMAAFGNNAMLQAQFPMPDIHEPLQDIIRLKALADIDDPKTTVLVVRDVPDQQQVNTSQGQDHGQDISAEDQAKLKSNRGPAIAFAKWAHPVAEGEDYAEPPWLWPERTNLDVLEGWTKKTEEAQQKALGRTPCYNGRVMEIDH